VHLKKGTHKLEHFLETRDADTCMAGKQCVSLGLEIAQLKKNIKGEQF
jgi:ATP-dependent protease ClpP protease subunit